MKHTLKTIILTGVAVGLGACSTCVVKEPYGGEPYVERTAGQGHAIWGDECKTMPEAKPVVKKTRAVTSPAATTFRAKQSK